MSIKVIHCAQRHKMEVNFRKAPLWPNLNGRRKTCDKIDFLPPPYEPYEM
jgi:hypothetical protein